MSYIVKTQPLFERNAGDAHALFYLEVITADISYETGKQSFLVNLIADANAVNGCTISGTNSVLNICGREFYFSDSIPLFEGYNLVSVFNLEGVDTALYNENLPVRLIFNHVCEEIGLTSGVDVSAAVRVNKIYTYPEVSPKHTTYSLGQNIELTGEFLSVGYDTFATVTVGGNRVYSARVGADGLIPTSLEWLNGYPTLTEATANVKVYAEFNGVRLNSDTDFDLRVNLLPDLCRPEFEYSAYPVSDIQAVQEYGKAVKTKSRFRISAENTVCKYGAVHSSTQITLDGQRYVGDFYETPVLTEAGMHSFSVTVTDSRGFSATKSGSFEVLDYAPPQFLATVTRVNENGEPDLAGGGLTVIYQTVNSFDFDGHNTFEHTICIKKASGGEAVLHEELYDGEENIFEDVFSSGVSYDVRVICEDTFGGATEKIYFIDCDKVELNIAKNKIGIGKIAENENLLDCAWPIRSEGDITFTDDEGNEVSLRSLYKMIIGQG